MKTKNGESADFLLGMLAALAVVSSHDNDTIYGEILNLVGYDDLHMAACEADNEYDLNHLEQFKKSNVL